MNIPHELSYLEEIGQEYLLLEWAKWPHILQKEFVRQVGQYSTDFFQEQQVALRYSNRRLPILRNPAAIVKKTDTLYALGKSILRERKVGLILLAGGQGSRLGFPGPKGCMPLPKLQKRTLLSILLNKCVELQNLPLPIAIMTSSSNHFPICTYLKKRNFFSLLPQQITVFQQKSFPLLNAEKNWYIQSPGLIGMGPGGNGAAFCDGNPILQKWKREGIEWIQVIPIDNPLSTPFDPYLIGCHVSNESDLVIPTIERNSDIAEVGVIGENNGKIYVQEYMDSHLQSNLSLAYIGIFSCNIDVALEWKASFPWHCARKKGSIYCGRGKQEIQEVWKLEKFLFDIFSLSNKYTLLMEKEEYCFAPIKNMDGKYSVETAQNHFLQWENTSRTISDK